MAAALCGTLALASCSTEADEPVVAPAAKQVSVTLTLPGGADTRTTYTEKKDDSDNFAGLKTAWAEGDKITLVKSGDFTNVVTLTQTGALSEGATTAIFTGDISALGEISESTTLFLFYPEITDNGEKCIDYRAQDGTLANLGKYDFLVDFSVKYKDGKLVPFTAGFERRSTFIRLPKDTYVGGSGSIDIELYGETGVIYSTNAPKKSTFSEVNGENNIHVSTTATTDGKLASDVYIAFGAGETGAAKVYLKIGANIYEVAGDGISFTLSKMYTITDLSKYKILDGYTDLSATATANTYMVTTAGKYKFKATVKGNGGIDPLTPTTTTTIDKASIAGVKVHWELKSMGLAIKHDGTDYDIFYKDGYVYFSTPDELVPGDAYVSVYNADNTILWSWLIWTTDTPEEKVYDGLTIMDRNIGALSVNSDTYAAGFLYQWGRKDPFPAGTSFGTGTQYTYVPTKDTAFSNESFDNGSTMEYTIEHPTTLIGPARYNWLKDDEFNVNLWLTSDSKKTIYDPCPAGWRIPSIDELKKVVSSKVVTLPGGGAAAGDSEFGGYCNGGSQYYWSSTADSNTEAWSYYEGTFRTASGSGWPDWRLSSAMSIRPVKE